MSDLTAKICVACEGGIPPLTAEQIAHYLPKLTTPWEVKEGTSLTKRYTFTNFKETMIFVNKIAELAEREGYHPDLSIRYNILDISLTTHAVKGLSENDFILAAKIEEL